MDEGMAHASIEEIIHIISIHYYPQIHPLNSFMLKYLDSHHLITFCFHISNQPPFCNDLPCDSVNVISATASTT